MKSQIIFCFIILLAFESCFAQSDSKYQNPFSIPNTKTHFRFQIPKPIFSVGSGNFESHERFHSVSSLHHMKDSTLLAHCKSKSDDLGEHVIKPGGKYYWMFSENLWQTTLFWCNFSSKHGHASGEVFWPEKSNSLSDRCDRNLYLGCKRRWHFFTSWCSKFISINIPLEMM